MKSLIISTSDLGGGAAIAGYRLHEGLRKHGIQSRMLVRDKLGKDPDVASHRTAEAEPEWMKASNRSLSGPARTNYSSTYFSLPWPGHSVETHPWVQEADVINIHWAAYFVSPESLRHLLSLGKPVVLTLHDERAYTGGCHYRGGCTGHHESCRACPQLHDDFRSMASGAYELLASCLEGVPKPVIVCPSEWLGNEARHSPLLQGCQVEVIPYGLDLSVFQKHNRAEARKRIGIPDKATAVLIGAQYLTDRRKGFDVIEGAVREISLNPQLSQMMERRELIFVAYGRDGEQLRKTRLPFTLVGEIHNPEEMAQIFSAVDLYLCSSREDNLPNTILEAMACGVPVLGSNVGGIPDMVINDETGMLFPAGDARALASLMAELLDHPTILQRWGIKAREKCETDYELVMQASRYASLYERLIASWPAASAPPVLPQLAAAQQKLKDSCVKVAANLPLVEQLLVTPKAVTIDKKVHTKPPSLLQRIKRLIRGGGSETRRPPAEYVSTQKGILHLPPDAFLPPVPVLSCKGLHDESFRDVALLLRDAKLRCELSIVTPHPAEKWNLRTERIKVKTHSSEAEEAQWLQTRPFALIVDDYLSAGVFRDECLRLACTGNLPILALGAMATGNDVILKELGVGKWLPFDAGELRAAIAWVCEPRQQLDSRRAAAALASLAE